MPTPTKYRLPTGNQRLLLCIPRGGLNDTLCQIQKCLDYAIEFDRTVIIDARKSGLMGQFDDYFSIDPHIQNIIPHLDHDIYPFLNSLRCVPASLHNRIDSFKSAFYSPFQQYVDIKNNMLIGFNFDRDYSEPLLVHEQAGGGTDSWELLSNVTLQPDVARHILSKLSVIKEDYVAIHIRNTDYQTDYQNLFSWLRPQLINKQILICSDDANMFEQARLTFDQSTVFSVSNTFAQINTQNQPLHIHEKYHNDLEKKNATIDALTDLLALGGASDLFFSKVITGQISGFSSLALFLYKKKYVIKNLLSHASAH